MEIYYLGHSSFRIKGKEASLVTDPFDSNLAKDIGENFPKVEAQVVTISHHHADHMAAGLVGGDPFIVEGPGEYEVKGISIFGSTSYHDEKAGKELGENTIYLIEMEGIRICHLGDLGEMLSEKKLEEIDGVDILMIPIGGAGYTLDPKSAVELITKIEPKIVLPMHYKTTASKGDFVKLANLEDFFKELGTSQNPPLPKLQISKDKLPLEERETIVLERKSA